MIRIQWDSQQHQDVLDLTNEKFIEKYPGLRTPTALDKRRQLLNQGKIPVELPLVTEQEVGAGILPYLVDKKEGELDWREVNKSLRDMQEVERKASWSQDEATFVFNDDRLKVIAISDFHLGSWSSDYDLLERVTDEILSVPDLYVILAGDMLQMSIKMRGVMEVSDNLLTPKLQMDYLISWLSAIEDRILVSGFDNHAVIRQEDLSGASQVADILGRKTVYHDGIGHADIVVGDEVYPIAMAHHFRSRSQTNAVMGPQRYIQTQGIDRVLAVAGDSHVPGIGVWMMGGKKRVAINTGSIQTNSTYAKRFYSLETYPVFPCFVLDGEQHNITPFWTVGEMLKYG